MNLTDRIREKTANDMKERKLNGRKTTGFINAQVGSQRLETLNQLALNMGMSTSCYLRALIDAVIEENKADDK